MKNVKELKKWYAQQVYVAEELEELVEMQKASDYQIEQGNTSEMTAIIYDLMLNNCQYPQFNANKCDDSTLGANNTIEFTYSGHNYKITVEKDRYRK